MAVWVLAGDRGTRITCACGGGRLASHLVGEKRHCQQALARAKALVQRAQPHVRNKHGDRRVHQHRGLGHPRGDEHAALGGVAGSSRRQVRWQVRVRGLAQGERR